MPRSELYRPSLQEVEEHVQGFADFTGLHLADPKTGQASLFGVQVPSRDRHMSLRGNSPHASLNIPLENGRRIYVERAARGTGPIFDGMFMREQRLVEHDDFQDMDGLSEISYEGLSDDGRDFTPHIIIQNRDQVRDFIDTVGKKHMSPQFQEISKRFGKGEKHEFTPYATKEGIPADEISVHTEWPDNPSYGSYHPLRSSHINWVGEDGT